MRGWGEWAGRNVWTGWSEWDVGMSCGYILIFRKDLPKELRLCFKSQKCFWVFVMKVGLYTQENYKMKRV